MPADMKPNLASARRRDDDDHVQSRHISLRAVTEPSVAQPSVVVAQGTTLQPIKNSELTVNLTAALVSVSQDAPMVLTTTSLGTDVLPSARYPTASQISLDACLRQGVADQTGSELGHAEQLQTFADRTNGLAIGYLALTRPAQSIGTTAVWRGWYDYLPWEDWRAGKPKLLAAAFEQRLRNWSMEPIGAADSHHSLPRADRVRLAFGLDRVPWNEERVVDRFDLLCDVGLMGTSELPSRAMRLDHLRVLASAIGRLRARLKVRPLVFELMDDEFTLFELQKTVEAVLGPHLHKQNFRRLVESAGLVEATGEVRSKTGGRPAKLFRFRREVLMERPAPGFRVHAQRL